MSLDAITSSCVLSTFLHSSLLNVTRLSFFCRRHRRHRRHLLRLGKSKLVSE